MNRTILATAGLLGGLGVALGALGAHALKGQLDADGLETFRTAVFYQLVHALFLLFLAVAGDDRVPGRKVLFRLVTAGVIAFSGSLYLLATAPLTGLETGWFGWITPLGGLLLISAWLLTFFRVLARKSG